jgi:hypothetical protein
MLSFGTLDSSVGTAMGYELDSQDSIPGRGKRFFTNLQRPDWLYGPSTFLLSVCPGPLSPRLKRPGLEADHSPLSRVEVKNGGATIHS